MLSLATISMNEPRINVNEQTGERLPQCLWGDGCLSRLNNQNHAEAYSHTDSPLKKCPIEECPLYHKAHNYIVGPPTVLTSEIRDAQKHSAVYYHPPVRSWSVLKTRPRPVVDINHSKKHKTVPKLDLGIIPKPHLPAEIASDAQSAPERKQEISHTPSQPMVVPNTDPTRKTHLSPHAIIVTPKRRSSSVNNNQIDSIVKELSSLKNRFSTSLDGLRQDLEFIKKDITSIKEILLSAVDANDNEEYDD